MLLKTEGDGSRKCSWKIEPWRSKLSTGHQQWRGVKTVQIYSSSLTKAKCYIKKSWRIQHLVRNTLYREEGMTCPKIFVLMKIPDGTVTTSNHTERQYFTFSSSEFLETSYSNPWLSIVLGCSGVATMSSPAGRVTKVLKLPIRNLKQRLASYSHQVSIATIKNLPASHFVARRPVQQSQTQTCSLLNSTETSQVSPDPESTPIPHLSNHMFAYFSVEHNCKVFMADSAIFWFISKIFERKRWNVCWLAVLQRVEIRKTGDCRFCGFLCTN